ncbi:MAG: phosphatidylserine decarboxylase family protein [Thermodesulfobacteriota bacterium]
MAEDNGKKYDWADAPSQSAFPIAKAGVPYILAAAFATAVTALLGIVPLALFFLVATACVCLFFRDPDRLIPSDKQVVVAPADGRVVAVESVPESRFVSGQRLKISIFMSVANVHINRSPLAGSVKNVQYYPGKFLVASLDKASEENEHNAVILSLEDGRDCAVVQIAGWVARRILCSVKPGDALAKGQRFGLISFGSRVDLFLPPDVTPKVAPGDRVRGGTSVIGILP